MDDAIITSPQKRIHSGDGLMSKKIIDYKRLKE